MAGDEVGHHCAWWKHEQVPVASLWEITTLFPDLLSCPLKCFDTNICSAYFTHNDEFALQCMYYVLCNQFDSMSLSYLYPKIITGYLSLR